MPDERHRGEAFGLSIRSAIDVPGLLPPGEARLPTLDLEIGDQRDLECAWDPAGATRLSEERFGGPEADRAIDASPRSGYRLFARYFGEAVVSPAGDRMLAVPPPIASWRWQRFLVGRCLPLAAMLCGYEVLHAGAIGDGGGVIAIIGPSGAGKTSLTWHLVRTGARFVTDDVLAVQERDGAIVAHAGIAVANLRGPEHELATSEAAAPSLRRLLGHSGSDKFHYEVSAPAAPAAPLRAVYFLLPRAPGATRITPLASPEPLRLLGSTFIHEIKPPDRLVRLLSVSRRLAADVPMYELAPSEGEDVATLAERLADHVDRTREPA